MQILEIKRKGKSNNYYLITSSGKYLVKDIDIIKHKLKVGDIEEESFFDILKECQKGLAFDEVISQVSGGYKTIYEIKQKLLAKGYFSPAINYAIDKSVEYKYLDDEKYIQAFLDTYSSSKGKLEIKRKLLLKGISDCLIEKYLKDYEDDFDNLYAYAVKYMKNKSLDIKTKEKLYRHLLSKGYTYDKVGSVVSKIFKGNNNESWN